VHMLRITATILEDPPQQHHDIRDQDDSYLVDPASRVRLTGALVTIVRRAAIAKKHRSSSQEPRADRSSRRENYPERMAIFRIHELPSLSSRWVYG
jgi:hypothetical protein